MEKIRVGLEMDKELHRQLKVKTAQEGTTMSAILIECAQQYVNAPPDSTTETREDYKPGK